MGAKGAGEKTVTQSLDPLTQEYRQEIFDRARGVSNQPYQASPYPGVAGANPLVGDAINGWRATSGDLARLGGFSEGMFHRANQMGQDYANQFGRVASEFGNSADQLQGTASGFDQLAGRMRGVGDRYTGMVGDMMGLGSQFDQRARGTDALAQGFDDRSAGMDKFGGQFADYLASGQLGARALGGDQSAISTLMNPYDRQVLDATSAQYDKMRGQASLEAKDAAARAGAFGGSRAAVAEGARLGELDQGQMATMAGLRAQGFNDTMNRAGQAANLGFGAGDMSLQGMQLGQSERGLGMDARRLGQGYNQLGMGARGLGAQFGGLGLSAEQVGQGYNGLGMDARQLGAQYDQMGLNARGMGVDASMGAYNLGLGALGQAGQLASARGALNNNIFNAGDYYRQIEQAKLDDANNRFREQRDWGVRGLDILKGGLSGMPYGQQTSEPLTRNAGAGILGGAATGAGIGSVIPGVGTAIGAGIGGLLGLFG